MLSRETGAASPTLSSEEYHWFQCGIRLPITLGNMIHFMQQGWTSVILIHLRWPRPKDTPSLSLQSVAKHGSELVQSDNQLHQELFIHPSTVNRKNIISVLRPGSWELGSAPDSATSSSHGFSQVTRFLITAFLCLTVQRRISVGLFPFIKFQDLFSKEVQKVYHTILMPEAQY